ncbi:signal peptidase I [Kineosporia sp. J2-2]|uniref:Signal peptidase I n=1 Tax=Kineosporia corallincola TaxID=2835133 RepID=A0ABS5TFH4_9ACTN|nr:signal peptidase I [Kineosporia corallincola]MBT0769802.1 signal peptidase I [Kineosporia corallincola]
MPERSQVSPFRRAAVALLAVAVTIALVRAFIMQSFVVPTGSMEPTVQIGDRVVVSRLSYVIGDIQRGDVIVFNGSGVFDPLDDGPDTLLGGIGRALAAVFSMPVGSTDYVKRVIGLPGDHVVCCDADGRITVNGEALDETYVAEGEAPSTTAFDVEVPEDRLWVMGDHRSDSADSRAHLGSPGGGTVPTDRVVGKVVGIYWPMSRIGGLDDGSDR